MSDNLDLALELDGIEFEEFDSIDANAPHLEVLGMTEVGASWQTNTNSISCSCCISCCCC